VDGFSIHSYNFFQDYERMERRDMGKTCPLHGAKEAF
jgi:hypothetical protein